MALKIIIISDTHGLHDKISVPEGDILIHAGDCTSVGKLEEIEAFNAWLGTLPHRHKILIAGNHDFAFQQAPFETKVRVTNAVYLEDSSVVAEGLKFYGSPWQPWFYDWAFNLRRGPEIAAKWSLIPHDTDILITHGPPFGHGDHAISGEYVGCKDLLRRVEEVKPKLHTFGHIHEAPGITHNAHTTFINASICNLAYQPVNKPTVYEL